MSAVKISFALQKKRQTSGVNFLLWMTAGSVKETATEQGLAIGSSTEKNSPTV